MIRKANLDDIDDILKIIKNVVVLMQEAGNDQWNSNYPSYKDFHNDILSENLFVYFDTNEKVKAFVCLNFHEPNEYKSVDWSLEKPALVIHRMAVSPECHGKGLAKELLKYAEEMSRELKINYIRSDTCSRNISMNALFKKFDYNLSGTIRFSGFKYDYNCYEKYLTQ